MTIGIAAFICLGVAVLGLAIFGVTLYRAFTSAQGHVPRRLAALFIGQATFVIGGAAFMILGTIWIVQQFATP